MREMRDAAARGSFRWLTPEEGGRPYGPPCGVYAVTALFVLGADAAGEEWLSDHWSILVDAPPEPAWEIEHVKLDFVARELVAEFLRPGMPVYVCEGSRRVAVGEITESYL